MALVVKNPRANTGNVRDAGLIPGSERPPGGGHSNPLQYSCLENPGDKGAWRTVYRTWGYKESDRTESFLKGDAVKVLHSICQQIQKTQQWPKD